MDSDWGYLKREYSVLDAVEEKYLQKEGFKNDPILVGSYNAVKSGLYALEKRMDELAEESESYY